MIFEVLFNPGWDMKICSFDLSLLICSWILRHNFCFSFFFYFKDVVRQSLPMFHLMLSDNDSFGLVTCFFFLCMSALLLWLRMHRRLENCGDSLPRVTQSACGRVTSRSNRRGRLIFFSKSEFLRLSLPRNITRAPRGRTAFRRNSNFFFTNSQILHLSCPQGIIDNVRNLITFLFALNNYLFLFPYLYIWLQQIIRWLCLLYLKLKLELNFRIFYCYITFLF